MAQTSTLFRLPPLSEDAFNLSIDSRPIVSVEAKFALPPLDEHASGTERLLSDFGKFSLYTDLKRPAEVPQVDGREEIDGGLEDEVEGIDGVWEEVGDENAEAGPSRPTKLFEPVRTWDKDDEPVGFLSEQPAVFEALITKADPPLTLPRLRTTAVVPTRDVKSLLTLLVRSTTGTVTTDALRWSSREGRLVYAEEKGRLQGVARGTAVSSIATLLEVGTAVRRLEIIVDTHSSTPLTPTHHAMLHAVSTYLTFIKQRLTVAIEENGAELVPAWTKWSVVLKDVRELAGKLCEVLCWPLNQVKPCHLPPRASSLLTHLHAHLLAHLSTSPDLHHGPIALSLAFLLHQSSAPFLGLLHQWVGLSDSSAIDTDPDPISQPWADVGVTRTLVQTIAGAAVTGSEEVKWEYTFSARRMPGFIPKDARRTLFEAGKSLRALRDASGGLHPLCYSSWGLKGSWGWGSDSKGFEVKAHVRRVDRELETWHTTRSNTRPLSGSSSISSLRLPKKLRKSLPPDFIQAAEPAKVNLPPTMGQELWDLFGQAPGSHLVASGDSTLWAPTPLDNLESFIARHSDPLSPLIPDDSPSLQLYITNELLAPLLAHSELITRSLVSLYLDDLGLLDHLDILRAFWLGGDVGFAERVGAALFGKDGAGAGEALGMGRRARTRARLGIDGGLSREKEVDGEWGIGLGLGLSERASWPPGGAELAYALRTTLVDESGGKGAAWDGIEDRVSFAIKALPEDQKDGRRARWLDPQAIEALDFLYLAYSPPPAIGILLPSSIMAKYQTILNLLLRIARCNRVVRSLYWDTIHSSHNDEVKVGVDYRPRNRQQTLFRTLPEIERLVRGLRFRMTHFVTAVEQYVMDTAIGTNWDVMRKRLERLRRKSMDSRPVTPAPDEEDFFELGSEPDYDGRDGEDGVDLPDEEEDVAKLNQLRSVHSVVLYHGVVLDRICRACLLTNHAGHQVTFKLLMSLFGLVLDLGKLVKEVEMGMRGMEVEESVERIRKEWDDKEVVFLHALERLSLRTPSKPAVAAAIDDDGSGAAGASKRGENGTQSLRETEHDLQMLLEGERAEEDEMGPGIVGGRRDAGVSELQELLLRLRLGKSRVRRREEDGI